MNVEFKKYRMIASACFAWCCMLGAPLAAAPTVEGVDMDNDGIDDVVLIQDDGSLVIPALPDTTPYDLSPGAVLRYTPSGTTGFTVELDTGSAELPAPGAPLALEVGEFPPDDGASEVNLPFTFTYLGQAYNSIWANSDGHITFGAPEASSGLRNVGRARSGPPRVSALLTDLDPICGGSVKADVRSDRIVVTWDDIPLLEREFDTGVCDPLGQTNTFQAVLYDTGVIEVYYVEVDPLVGSDIDANGEPADGFQEGVVGVSAGSSGPLPLTLFDASAGVPVTAELGALVEQYSPPSEVPILDTFDVGNLFYQFYPDHFDELMIFRNFGGGCCFNQTINSPTLGIGGRGVRDFSFVAGSAGELESFISMSDARRTVGAAGVDADQLLDPRPLFYNPDLRNLVGESFFEDNGFEDISSELGVFTGYSHSAPYDEVDIERDSTDTAAGALRGDTFGPISVLYHESWHRWGPIVDFIHPTFGLSAPDSMDLIGRDGVHWSHFVDLPVPGEAFGGGPVRADAMDGVVNVHIGLNEHGEVIDLDQPERVLRDPLGELTNTIMACEAQGREAFLTAPDQWIDGSAQLSQYLMGVRRAEEMDPWFYADDPTSPFDANLSLDDTRVQREYRGRDDLAFCGVRVDLDIQDILDVATIIQDPVYGERGPLVGDEGDDFDPANAALRPDAAAALNLDAFPIQNDPECNAPLGDESRRGAICVDVKTQAYILVQQLGTDDVEPAIFKMNEFRKAFNTYANEQASEGRGARGKVGDDNFIPKWDTSLFPIIH